MLNPLAKKHLSFEAFFESDLDDQYNPFISEHSRSWGKDLPLRISLLSGISLAVAFVLSFFTQHAPLAQSFLILSYFLSGTPALIQTLRNFSRFTISISSLMTISAFLSFLIGSEYEGGLLLFLFAASGALEHTVMNKAKASLSDLHKLNPSKALLLTPQGYHLEKSVKDIKVGDKILIKAGELIPLDGKVIEGSSDVSYAHLTGEATPLPKKEGDSLLAGAKNFDGLLVLEVSAPHKHSTLSKLIELITKAHEKKPSLQQSFDRYGAIYAKTVIVLTLLFALFFFFVIDLPFLGTNGALYRALAFLIGASPCALILALPISYLSAISVCSSKGILLKGGVSLDLLATCKAMAFDKTGTLTKGDLSLEKIHIISGNLKEEQILAIAACVEKGSTHPIAQAIEKKAKLKQLNLPFFQETQNITGKGMQADVLFESIQDKCLIGKASFVLPQLSLENQQKLEEKIKQLSQDKWILSSFVFGESLAVFCFQDPVRDQAKTTIANLQNQLKLKILMLTGDQASNAHHLANTLHIESYHAELSPEEKLNIIKKLNTQTPLAMVGDGLNDAPSLSQARCGISMGQVGSYKAIEAANIVLLHDDFASLPWLYRFAKQTRKIVIQNLFISAFAICITCATSLMGWIPLWLAVICHEGSTLLVGFNGLRLLKK